MEPFLSLVIPCYNGEAFLTRCLDSVLAQDCGNYEVILVDDGSTDNTPAICDSYTKKGIQVIHTPNQGPAEARNLAISKAVGEYIWCIDSDDMIEPNAVGIIISAIQEKYPDMLRFSHTIEKDGQDLNVYNPFEAGYYTGDTLLKMKKYAISDVAPVQLLLWNHVYRASLMKQIPLLPWKDYLPEDYSFNQRYIPRIESLYIIDNKIYRHLVRSDSLSFAKTHKSSDQALNLYRVLKDDYTALGVFESYRDSLAHYFIDILFLGCGKKHCGVIYSEYLYQPSLDEAHEHVKSILSDSTFKEILAFAFYRKADWRYVRLYPLLSPKNEELLYRAIMDSP